jgi:hypothetical protein
MKRFIESFTELDRRQTDLPNLDRRAIVGEFDLADQDRKTQLLMRLGVSPDPEHMQKLTKKYDSDDPLILQKRLPRPRANWKRRFKMWLATVTGSYLSDPHRWEMTGRNDYL